ELFRFFQFYKEEHPGSGNLQLILIGKLGMKLPADPSIRYIGFVDEGDKLSAMAGAIAVVQPSRMESLSIVTLEAFSVGTPVMATAHSRVLADHCRKANAGLYYGDFEEFEEILTLLLNDRNLGRSLGRNGQTYVKDNYGWNRLLPKYELVFRSSARPAREPRGARRGPLAASEALPPHELEQEELVSTGDLPLLEPEPEPESEAEPEEAGFEARDEEPPPGEPYEAETEYEDTESAPEDGDARPEMLDSYLAREEEPYSEPPPEPDAAPREAAPEESSAPNEGDGAEEGGLPAFYRPRPRPVPKAPEPTKED
ncbi:MAG TPA: glycosyltransferase, partial [Vicinamibacteria bacterium]